MLEAARCSGVGRPSKSQYLQLQPSLRLPDLFALFDMCTRGLLHRLASHSAPLQLNRVSKLVEA